MQTTSVTDSDGSTRIQQYLGWLHRSDDQNQDDQDRKFRPLGLCRIIAAAESEDVSDGDEEPAK